MGSGLQTSFWEDPWLRSFLLKFKFPGFFSNSLHKEGLVGEIWEVINRVFTRDFRWRRSFFLKEFSILEEFPALLIDVILTLDIYEGIWMHSSDGGFSVASIYLVQGGVCRHIWLFYHYRVIFFHLFVVGLHLRS